MTQFLKLLLRFVVLMFGFAAAHGQSFPIDTLAYSVGSNRINLVYLADGYTNAELPQFQLDCKSTNDYLFQTSPYKEYKAYFNVFAVRVPSPESGVKHANSAPDCPLGSGFEQSANPQNYFGSHFDAFGSHRLVVADSTLKIQAVLAANFPSYHQVMLIANSTNYGGSGGEWATITKERSSLDVAIHEMGHSFAGLADEYWAGPQYAAEKPNMTQQAKASLVRWKNWVGTNSVGVYPFAENPLWYRPVTGFRCKMEVLDKPLCPVCTETIIERIHQLVQPIDNYTPATAQLVTTNTAQDFKLNLVKPDPNTLQVVWQLDGIPIAEGVDSVRLSASQIGAGAHIVTAAVIDATGLSRSNNHSTLHSYVVQWNLNPGAEVISPAPLKASFRVYPIPFRSELFVSYELNALAAVRLELLDAQGHLLRTVERNKQNAGKYTLTLVPTNVHLAAGTYFVRLWLNGSRHTVETIHVK